MKLTKSVLDKARFEGTGRGAYILWDDEVPGFGVRIYPSEKKSFVITYRIKGRTRQPAIGAYGILTLDQARKEARRLLVMVNSGMDPFGEKVNQKTEDTMESLCRLYLERHSKIHNKPATWKEDERRILTRILPAFGSWKIQAVQRSDVTQLHTQIGSRHPYEANRTRSLISSMFERAREWGMIPENHPNPAKGVRRFKESKRDRWVTPKEMPQLASAIEAEENIYVRMALWLYLLTGMRKRELLRVRWDDVDFTNRQIRLADTKAGRTHYVELSSAALQILQSIPREECNSYVIVGKKPGKSMVNIDVPWKRVRSRAGIEDVRLHDLRRTFGSWLAMQGTPLLHIGKLLNHSNAATTEVYAHLSTNPLRQAVEEVSVRILKKSKATGLLDE